MSTPDQSLPSGDVSVERRTDESGRGRSIASGVLCAVAIVAAPLLMVGLWVDQQLDDTDRYVASVSPVSHDPDVQQFVASELATAFSDQVDLNAELAKDLPPELQALSQPIAAGLDGVIEDAANRFTQSEAFHKIWIEANRIAHPILVGVLTGERDAVEVSDGRVTVELGDALRELQARLVADGLAIAGRVDLSGVNHPIVIADGPSIAAIEDAREIIGTIQDLVWPLALVTIFAGAASIIVAPRRSRAVVRLGVGLAVGVVVALIAVSITKNAFLDDVGTVPSPVVEAYFDALSDSLRIGLRFAFVVGLVVAILAVVVMQPAYSTRWARPAQFSVLGIGLIALILPDRLTTQYTLAVALCTVAAIVLLEVLRRQPPGTYAGTDREPPPPTTTAPPTTVAPG